jgi:hypothetical protein
LSVDAIIGAPSDAPVIADACTGCDLCLPPCRWTASRWWQDPDPAHGPGRGRRHRRMAGAASEGPRMHADRRNGRSRPGGSCTIFRAACAAATRRSPAGAQERRSCRHACSCRCFSARARGRNRWSGSASGC